MTELSYYAKRIVQWDGAPPLYVISVSPEELLSWSDVPRKAPNAMAGYQRHLSHDRAEEISEFMQKHINHIVPGTVIVASENSSDGEGIFDIEPVFVDGVHEDVHNLFKITFDYEYDLHPEDITTDQLKTMLEEIIEGHESRLTDEEKAMIVEEEAVYQSDDNNLSDEGSSDEEMDEEEIEEQNLIKGSGFVQFVKKLLQLKESDILSALDHDEITIPLMDIEGLSEAEAAQYEADKLRAEEDALALHENQRHAEEWKEWIISEHKIGNIMDGQHRVWGALGMNPEDCDHLGDGEEPHISVTLIPDLKRAEQVFQFAMMNLTPKKVKPGLARSGAIHSLTMPELEQFDERMAEYMDVTSARWVNELHTAPESPFRGYLTWDYLENPEKLFVDEKILIQIAKRWYKRTSKTKLFGSVFIDGVAWNTDTTMLDFRLKAFFTFWGKIAEKFPEDWTNKNSNIWLKTALWVLQDWVLIQMLQQRSLWVKSNPPPMDDLNSLADLVEHCLDEFPSDFFKQPWTHVDDTTEGKEKLLAQFNYQNNKTKVYKGTWLYQGAGK